MSAEGYEPMQVDVGLEENDNEESSEARTASRGSYPAAAFPVALSRPGAGGVGVVGTMDLYGGGGEESKVSYNVENPTLDLESYAQGYSGLARLYRLRFIARHCPMLRTEALKLAIHYCSQTHNTPLYAELHKKLAASAVSDFSAAASSLSGGSLPDVAVGQGQRASGRDVPADITVAEWIEARGKKAALKLEKLDTDLKNYKSNSIKESIRRGHDDLGDHYLDCGDLSSALKCYSRARDYCTTGRHVVSMCVNVVRVSVYLQNWSHVVSYVNKAMAAPDFSDGGTNKSNSDQPALLTRLRCAYGLAQLATHKYKAAALKFLSAQLDHCDLPDLMSAQNVATYGGLCALATFDRRELHKQVLQSTNFKLFLELDPQLREAIICFQSSKYGKCLRILEEMKDNLMLDMYLARHVESLFSKIRNRSLIQYFSPYVSADLRLMASSFNTTVGQLEDEMISLILDGQIQARIDSHNKVLYSQDIDQRSVTFERVMEMSMLYQKRARMTILRSAILKSNIIVAPGGSGNRKSDNS